MSLNVQDIQTKQFHVRFRGFDMEEVDGFLEQVAENFSLLVEENKRLTAKCEDSTIEVERLKEEESSFKDAILSAQKVADEMVRKARRDADEMLAKAGQEIQALKDEAHREVTALESRVEQLKGLQSDLESDLRKVIDSYIAVLDQTPKVTIVSEEQERTMEHPLEESLVQESVESEDEPAEEQSVDESSEESAEEVHAEALTEERQEMPDLSDLYEKIDLGDDPLAALESPPPLDSDVETEMRDEAVDQAAADEKTPQEFSLEVEEPAKTIPDFDNDEILFTLQDPLDEEDEEVQVSIDRDDERS